MASTTCGHCGRIAHMEPVSGLHVVADTYGHGSTWQATFACSNCHHLSLANEHHPGREEQTQILPAALAGEESVWHVPEWLPRHGEVREFGDVPEHIASAATEATLCLSVGAYRAVGSLARAVIEATAKDKAAAGKDLRARIDWLRAADHIRAHTQEQAHEIRHFGNDMAHGDFVDRVTKEEAEEVVELMAEVLDEVYQSPARLQRRKAARLAKMDGAATK